MIEYIRKLPNLNLLFCVMKVLGDSTMKIFSLLLILFNFIKISVANNQINLKCDVKDNTCNLWNVTVTSEAINYQIIPDETVEKVYFRANSFLKVLTSAVCDALPNLKIFYSTSVQLMSIDENAFQNCKKVDEISLFSNALSTVPEGLFEQNPHLRKVYMYYNEIKSIPENLFKYNSDLEMVGLAYNLLKFLPKNIFKHNKKLETLSLHGNQLQNINFLETMPVQMNKVDFYIDRNQLTNLNIRLIFHKFPKIQKLHIKNNKFLCEHEKSLIKILKQKNVSIGDYEENCIEKVSDWLDIKLSYEFNEESDNQTLNNELQTKDQTIIIAFAIFASVAILIIICFIIYIIRMKKKLNEYKLEQEMKKAETYYDAQNFAERSNNVQRNNIDSCQIYENVEADYREQDDTYDHLDFKNNLEMFKKFDFKPKPKF